MQRFTFKPLTWSLSPNHLHVKGLIGTHVTNLDIPLGTTYLFKSSESLSAEEKLNLFEYYDASKGGASILDNKVLIVRNPVVPDSNDEDTEVEWDSSIQDPVGKIASFFQSSGIKPYLPFDVFLPDSSSPRSQEITESQILKSNNKEKSELRRLYWDLEMVTARKEFVYAKYIDNHIIAVSMVFTYKNVMRKIFLYWGSYIIENHNFESYRFSNEADVLRKFYSLIHELEPDRMYTYNGDSFDIPYLIERTKLFKIKPEGITFERARIKGRFKWETVNQLNIPGVEHIDIIRVMLKMYPGLPNYKLETVGKVFLGEGKTGLPIEQMFRSFWEQSPQGMEDLAEYSVQDSVLLSKLNTVVNIDYLLENVCNSAGMLIEDILDTYDSDIISKIGYLVDPGSHYLKENSNSGYLSTIKLGVIYKNVHIYDYTMFYTLEMAASEDEYLYSLSEVSQDLPGTLKAGLYYSKYNSKNSSDTKLIKNLIEYYSGTAIEITAMNIKLLNPIGLNDEISPGVVASDVLKLVNRYTHFLPLGKVSFVARNWLGDLLKIGTMKVVKPTFKLGHLHLDDILRYLFDDLGTLKRPGIPAIQNAKVEELLIDGKIKDVGEYPVGSLKHKLASQYGLKINTWVPVKYYMTLDGPILIDLYKGEHIDDDWYLKEIKKLRELLKYKK